MEQLYVKSSNLSLWSKWIRSDLAQNFFNF